MILLTSFPIETQALPLLKNGSLTEVTDPRLEDISNTQTVHHLSQAALLCLNGDSGHKLSISEVRFLHLDFLHYQNNTWNLFL